MIVLWNADLKAVKGEVVKWSNKMSDWNLAKLPLWRFLDMLGSGTNCSTRFCFRFLITCKTFITWACVLGWVFLGRFLHLRFGQVYCLAQKCVSVRCCAHPPSLLFPPSPSLPHLPPVKKKRDLKTYIPANLKKFCALSVLCASWACFYPSSWGIKMLQDLQRKEMWIENTVQQWCCWLVIWSLIQMQSGEVLH